MVTVERPGDAKAGHRRVKSNEQSIIDSLIGQVMFCHLIMLLAGEGLPPFVCLGDLGDLGEMV